MHNLLSKYSLPKTFVRLTIAAVTVMLCMTMQWIPNPKGTFLTDELLRDWIFRLQATQVAENRVVVVDIDEVSLKGIGPWPWSRAQIATLLESLVYDYGVRGVALDMVLPESADKLGDERLAVLAEHAPIVFAQAFDYVERAAPLRVGVLAGKYATPNFLPAAPASGFIANHGGLARAKLVGNIGFVPDADGVLRRLPMLTSFAGHNYPALSLALVECCAGTHFIHQVLKNSETFARVPFKYDWSAYTVLSAGDVLHLRVPIQSLSGRLVVIGSSSLGLSDRVSTPLSSSTAGVMIHAEQVSALLDAQSGITPSHWDGSLIAVLFSTLVAVLVVYTAQRHSAIVSMLMLAAASIAWLGLAYLANPHDGYYSLSAPLLCNLFLLLIAVPFEWQLSQQSSKKLLGTLHQYVAKSVVDELLKSPLKNPLSPISREVTTLIADMEGYTSQVESLSVEEAARLTHDFLDCLTRPVLMLGGTLDKYTGDGLVAFWGAPLPNDAHADLALDAAQLILQEVKQLSSTRQQEGKPPIRVRIGVESGVAMAGDFGSSSRSIYTAVGDSVNTASRLQDFARNYPFDILIGQGAVGWSNRHNFIPLGEVNLRGKENATKIYALIIAGSNMKCNA